MVGQYDLWRAPSLVCCGGVTPARIYNEPISNPCRLKQNLKHSQLSHCVMKQLVLPAARRSSWPDAPLCCSIPSAPSYWLPLDPSGLNP